MPVEFQKPHYSTKMCRAHYRYFKEFYTKELYEEICRELRMPLSYLQNDENWVSNEFIYEYFSKMRLKTGEPNIAEKIGLFTLTADAMNPLEHYLLKSIPPFFGFLAISKTKDKLNKITDTKIESFRPGYFSFSTKPLTEEIPHPGVCDNTVGILKSVKDLHDLKNVDVEHTHCIHKGSDKCVFTVRYDSSRYWLAKLKELAVPIVLISILMLSTLWLQESTKQFISRFPSATVSFLLIIIAAGATIFKRYRALLKYNSIYHTNSLKRYEELFQKNLKLDRRFNESVTLKNLCSTLVKVNSAQEVIRLCVDEMETRFGYSRLMVMLLSSKKDSLFTKEARGFGYNTPQLYALTFQYPGSPSSPLFFSNILKSGKTAFIKDIPSYAQNLRDDNQKLLRSFGVTSLIVAPIQDEAQKFGLIVVGTVGRDQPMTEEDLHLIQNITNLLSLFFMNASNFQREQTLRHVFQKYVPKAVMESVHAIGDERQSLVPKMAKITSMFIDLRGFTSLSEELEPEKIVEILNKYIAFVSTRLSQEGAIIDNLIGDGIVAFFVNGSNLREENHAEKAMRAAMKILSEWEDFNSWLISKNYKKMGLGIGLHSGNAFIGNVGSDLRTNYTAIGDTINLASRLQDLSKKYWDSKDVENTSCILFSKSTFDQIHYKFPHRKLGPVRVRGREDSVEIGIITLIDIKNYWQSSRVG